MRFTTGELTVKNSLAKGHHSRAEHQENCKRAGVPIDGALSQEASSRRLRAPASSHLTAERIHHVEVVRIHGRLNDVQEALRSREAIVFIERLPAVDIVHLDI